MAAEIWQEIRFFTKASFKYLKWFKSISLTVLTHTKEQELTTKASRRKHAILREGSKTNMKIHFSNTSNTQKMYFHSISSDLNDQIWGLKMPMRLTTENLGVWNNWLKLFSSSITATVQWITKSIRDSLYKGFQEFIWLFSSSKNLK